MKRIYFAIILILGISFVGCGDVNIQSKTDIQKNGKVEFTLKILYDDEAKSFINDEFIAKGLKLDNVEVDKYKQGQWNVEEIKIDAKGVENLRTNESIEKLFNYSIQRKDYFYKTIYNIQMSINKNIFNIKDNYNTKEDIDYINNIPFSNVVSFRGKLVNSNAMEYIGMNEVKWNYKVSELTEDTKMQISYEINTIWKVIVSILLVLIILIGIVVTRNLKNKRKKSMAKRIH
ncbi:hypothetical protein [uncultured Clostridium sp.]|uniref:hypothetical protein n=1 Tax=uncultured Clostridium sp. TaxID=59620 RepID=UPI00262B66F6|nr:hypothetical protein [uncultured Clostridium sp.]